MRVSGRKLRLAVGTGITALMLTVGVSAVGATAPGTVGNVNVVVTSAGSSALGSSSTAMTAATYRDAVVITNKLSGAGGLAGNYDGCSFSTGTEESTNQGTPSQPAGNLSTTDVSSFVCGATNPIIQPAAYPLWLVVNGTSARYFVIPPTGNNEADPGKTYVFGTFR
ncbi:MAG: hypothetical protein M3008_12400 [Chloroflexota bacterium]|nr:hypothetical protein [Chloroflexota bacterium]